MKKNLFLMALAFFFGVLTAMSKETMEKEITVTHFNEVLVMSSVKVYYEQGEKYSCSITATPKDMETIQVKGKDKTLTISTVTSEKDVEGVRFDIAKKLSGEVIVRVSSPELKGMTCVGSGEFIATNNLRSDSFSFTITGSGEIKTKKVIAKSLSLAIAGSGEASLFEADADHLTATISGSGDLDTQEVSPRCQEATFNIFGSGEIAAHFSDCKNLKCKIAGSGEMELDGKVKNFTSSIFGSGEIKRRNLAISGNCIENNLRSKNGSGIKTVNNITPEP